MDPTGSFRVYKPDTPKDIDIDRVKGDVSLLTTKHPVQLQMENTAGKKERTVLS
jgi:hypothetical protein